MKKYFLYLILLIAGVLIGLGLPRLFKPASKDETADSVREQVTPIQTSRPGTGTPTPTEPSAAPPKREKRMKDTTSMDQVSKSSQDFEDLMNRVFLGQATEDESLAFWQEARNSPELDAFIGELEGEIETNQEDVAKRMNLAGLYIAKLYGATAGPERGIWAAKAERQWKAVLEQEPLHWEAQHSLATSLSRYPDFLNKTGEAISQYENLLTIQDKIEQQVGFLSPYTELSRLYLKNGDPGGALSTVERGLAAFPEDPKLIELKKSLHQQYVFE